MTFMHHNVYTDFIHAGILVLRQLGTERVNCSDYSVYVKHSFSDKSCSMASVLD